MKKEELDNKMKEEGFISKHPNKFAYPSTLVGKVDDVLNSHKNPSEIRIINTGSIEDAVSKGLFGMYLIYVKK